MRDCSLHRVHIILCFLDCACPEAHVVEAGVAIEVILLAYLVAHRVHQDVDAHDFVEFTHPQFTEGVHGFEVDVAGGRDPEEQGNRAQKLNAYLHEVVSTTLYHSAFATKDTDVEEAEEAADAMDLDCFDGVVDAASLQQLRGHQVNDA